MISGFVFITMVMIEYINVQSKGVWQKHLTGNKWKIYHCGTIGGITGLSRSLYSCCFILTSINFFCGCGNYHDCNQWRLNFCGVRYVPKTSVNTNYYTIDNQNFSRLFDR